MNASPISCVLWTSVLLLSIALAGKQHLSAAVNHLHRVPQTCVVVFGSPTPTCSATPSKTQHMSVNQTHAPHVTAIELTGEYTTTLGQPPVSAATCTSRTPIAVSIRSWRVLPSSSLPPRSSPAHPPPCSDRRQQPVQHSTHSSR
jgi:hypothetical protein